MIIDEAHRSVYQKYGAIFRYFDSLLVGLTATPREEVDRNTYGLFDLEPGMPTDAYELETAVADGFLVPPRVQQVDLKFPRQGIDYDSLSDEEKEQWESLDWGDDVDENGLPDRVNASAINSWLFNKDTVDKVLQHLMEHGHKVEGGDRLAKTIIFARNHEHAKFIEERFNHHYPHYRGHFARIIDHYAKYPQSLLDDFSQKDKAPHIAISVDMLDTGIDIPEVANLVFFKPVYSKIKFWQMIGRGTRLCPGSVRSGRRQAGLPRLRLLLQLRLLQGESRRYRGQWRRPARHAALPLPCAAAGPCSGDAGARPGYRARGVTDRPTPWGSGGDEPGELHRADAPGGSGALPGCVKRGSNSAMPTVRRCSVRSRGCRARSRRTTSSHGCSISRLCVCSSPWRRATPAVFEKHRQRVVEIAMLLEEKTTIPAVKAQLAYLAAVQESGFWEGIDLNGLEELRLRLRGLVPFLDKKKRKIVYTDFQDEVMGVRTEEARSPCRR